MLQGTWKLPQVEILRGSHSLIFTWIALAASTYAIIVPIVLVLLVRRFLRLKDQEIKRKLLRAAVHVTFILETIVPILISLASGVTWWFHPPSALGLALAAILYPADLGVHYVFAFISCMRDHKRVFVRLRPLGEIPKELLDQLYYIGLPEEFTCRGLLISHLSSILEYWQAALASALVFGMFHLPYHGWFKSIECTLSGLLYASIMVISRSVWPSVVLHVALNMFIRIERIPTTT